MLAPRRRLSCFKMVSRPRALTVAKKTHRDTKLQGHKRETETDTRGDERARGTQNRLRDRYRKTKPQTHTRDTGRDIGTQTDTKTDTDRRSHKQTRDKIHQRYTATHKETNAARWSHR